MARCRDGLSTVELNLRHAEGRLRKLAHYAAVQMQRVGAVSPSISAEIAQIRVQVAAWRAGETDATI
jgi:hypothetical protein